MKGCWCLVVCVWLSVVGSFVWKTVPSKARVTRDAVSGLKQRRGELSGRQYLACVCSSHFLYVLVLSSRQFFFVILYIPRLRPGIHESGCYMAGWHNVVINMVLLAKYLKHMKK